MTDRDESTRGEEVPVVGHGVRLGPHWVAIIQPDGTVLLQNLSNVVLGGSGEVLDLNNPNNVRPEVHELLQEYDPNRLAVRTLCLLGDGSVVADPDGISPKGELTAEQYQVIAPTIPSSHRFFARKSGGSNW